MFITKTNWLKLLKEDILARQTLYPHGGDVGRLTSTNWLKKLRDDILKEQKLYPTAEDKGHLTSTNFLIILRDDFIERQDLFPEGSPSYMALWRLIRDATALMNDTMISQDGTNVPKDKYWVTSGVRLVFYNAIAAAQKVLDDPLSEDPDYDTAYATLDVAMTNFSNARQPGTWEPTSPKWSITFEQPVYVTMQRLIIPISSFTGYTATMLADMNDTTHGVYNQNFEPTGNVKLFVQFVTDPQEVEVPLDDPAPTIPNTLSVWEWETPNIRVTGSNTTGEPIQIRLELGGSA